MQNCAKCHKLFEQGGQIGPDLTSYKRDDVGRMLMNIVNPSAEVREGFENYQVVTVDGRVLNGFLADRTTRWWCCVARTGRTRRLPRRHRRNAARFTFDDAGRRAQDFNDQQIRDLFAYLRSTQPLPD